MQIETVTCPAPSPGGPFEVTLLRPPSPRGALVFAAGRGGNPARHMELLRHLADQGIHVAAPHLGPVASPVPSGAELLERTHRLASVVARYCPSELGVAGMGHSLGTVCLLVLTGAIAQTMAGEPVAFRSERQLDRLVLLAPPTDFFRGPGALDGVAAPLQAWVGEADTIAPPAQADLLVAAVGQRTCVDVRIVENAGHFTFMDEPPPNIPEPHPARAAFLRTLREETTNFLFQEE